MADQDHPATADLRVCQVRPAPRVFKENEASRDFQEWEDPQARLVLKGYVGTRAIGDTSEQAWREDKACRDRQGHRDRPEWVDRATRASEERLDVPVRLECKASPAHRVREESATATRPPTQCNTWRGYSGSETVQEDRKHRGPRGPQAANDSIIANTDVVVVVVPTVPYPHTVCVVTGITLTVQLA